MSAECARAAAASRGSVRSGLQPALARSALVSATTAFAWPGAAGASVDPPAGGSPSSVDGFVFAVDGVGDGDEEGAVLCVGVTAPLAGASAGAVRAPRPGPAPP